MKSLPYKYSNELIAAQLNATIRYNSCSNMYFKPL